MLTYSKFKFNAIIVYNCRSIITPHISAWLTDLTLSGLSTPGEDMEIQLLSIIMGGSHPVCHFVGNYIEYEVAFKPLYL